jgi:hypothetical protein
MKRAMVERCILSPLFILQEELNRSWFASKREAGANADAVKAGSGLLFYQVKTTRERAFELKSMVVSSIDNK